MRETGPQFGRREPGLTYVPRPGAYALVTRREGLLLCVRVGDHLHLPGGAIEAGEDLHAAVRRELLEEIGCGGTVVEEVGRARQYVARLSTGEAWNKLGVFVRVRLDEDGEVRVRGDHVPVDLPIREAAERLHHPFQRWIAAQLDDRA